MVQRCEDFSFSLEPGEPLRVSGKRLGQDLERHLALELRISRLIDLPHASLADEGGHVVVSEAVTDGERHKLLELARFRADYTARMVRDYGKSPH